MSNKSKNEPTKWFPVDEGDHHTINYKVGEKTYVDAAVFGKGRSRRKKQAQLIAAAPEMLEALKAFVGYDGEPECIPAGYFRAANQVIARAEGRAE